MKLDDLELIERTLGGDTRAFEELVLRYQDRLYNAVVHTVGCAEEARDIVQEAFLSAYSKLHSFQGNASFYTWLYRIGFNASISHRRKRRPVLSVDPQRDENGVEPIDRHESPEAPLQRAERVAQVQQALSLVSEEHRRILVLREMDGLDYETIADMLDLPIGTVRSRLHRARSQLKETLESMLEGHPTDG
ncbi:MAG: sigma-70 family RNA polymerase sigma factor [Pirellulaceae bacterium]|nr:sigma-70 family RNA polymerase sigma factor [Planctomycetales bacterium]